MSERIAGDVDYGALDGGYAAQRRTDPRIAALVHAALGDARTVLNVGAGAGSYEPSDRHVIAIEPSSAMRAQRPPHAVPAIDATAEKLPLDDRSVDAAMATVTVHQWRDLKQGLQEMRRVARGPIVILAFEHDGLGRYWFEDYAPEIVAVERRRDPPYALICDYLGGKTDMRVVPIPIDCTDGFREAFYARPEKFLDPAVRRAQSSWSFVSQEVQSRIVATLAADLKSGAWDARYDEWRRKPVFEGTLRLFVNSPGA